MNKNRICISPYLQLLGSRNSYLYFGHFLQKTKQKTNIEINYTYVVSTHKNTQTYFKKKEEEKSNFEGSDLT